MSHKVDPPPQVKIPRKFLEDQEVRGFFEQQQHIIFQLWIRTGGSFDSVAASQIVVIATGDLILDTFGSLIVSSGDSEQIDIKLPPIGPSNVGEKVEIVVIDATFNTVITAAGSSTIVGDTSVIMNRQWMSISFVAVTEAVWVIAG